MISSNLFVKLRIRLWFAEGVRNSSIWIPGGRGGWGWCRFVGELRQMILDAKSGSKFLRCHSLRGNRRGFPVAPTLSCFDRWRRRV